MTKAVAAHGEFCKVFDELGFPNSTLATVVEISVACRNLADKDLLSKSDPLVVLFTKDSDVDNWKEHARTEIVWNNLNPNFVQKFMLEYFFEQRQLLRFEVYDVDSKSPDLSKHDYLGNAECTVGEIVSSGRLKRDLSDRHGGPAKGHCILTAEELQRCKEEVTMQFCGKGLDKKDTFGKSDPFLFFYRTNEGGSTIVHKTEVIKNTLNPTWKPFTIPVRALCNGDYHRPILVECFDYNKNGSHSLIGTFTTTMNELQEGPGSSNNYECINAKKKAAKEKKYQHSGIVELVTYRTQMVHTFLDYIQGGCQIHCTIAIDFTSSNGDPRSPESLHCSNPTQPNQYQMALKAVGNIIQDYDSDKLFPALGFGARLPPDGRVSHEFFLNGHQDNPYCQGVEGVLQAYRKTLDTVTLHGPTNFAPCINHVARLAGQHEDGNNYFILLIITDGEITDMAQTSEAIVKASSLPLSIIIVGVGNDNFEAMDILDGDGENRLSSKGRFAERDIVQFVPFRNYYDVGGNYTRSQARLAKEVLAEIPDQFQSYMKGRGFTPKPPLRRHDSFPTAPRS